MSNTFNLQAAIAGAPIKAPWGNEATFVSHVPSADSDERVVILVDGSIYTADEYGNTGDGFLTMAPKTVTKYVNLYAPRDGKRRGGYYMHDTQAKADRAASKSKFTRVGGAAVVVQIPA